MAQSQYEHGLVRQATFDLVVRRLPSDWGMLIAAGLGGALDFVSSLRFSAQDVALLQRTGRFSNAFLERLSRLRFTGDVHALHEGCPVFAGEPLLSVVAPLPEAQILETALLNAIQLPTLAASKAARCVHAARGRDVVDFAMRRAHGSDVAHQVTRSSWLAGMAGTSNVHAGILAEIPVVGTMAHSYVLAFENEIDAFRAYARSYPEACVLVLDTYDTLGGLANAARVAHEMRARGDELSGVRLDSGDLAELSKSARAFLDEQGLEGVRILASGGLDEYGIDALLAAAAPIDGFGIGTNLGAPPDAPTLDAVYKLAEYDGRPVAKRSPGKASVPGAKQVWRRVRDDTASGDVVGCASENLAGRALLREFIRAGELSQDSPTLHDARAQCATWIREIPEAHRRIRSPEAYPIDVSPALLNVRTFDDPL
jgi:nicotinate phosphoribosyltransferase